MKTIQQHFSKTIFGIAFLAVFMLMYSCSQETVLDSPENIEAVTAKSENANRATRAWRGKFTNAPDFNILLTTCAPEEFGVALTTNIISGNMTHMGKMQEGSYGRPQPGTCNLTEIGTIEVIFHVNYIGAHGDMITTEEYVTIIPDYEADPDGLTGTFTNTLDEFGERIPITILEGTGRFEGAEGKLYFKDATFVPDPNSPGTLGSWELVGEITY